MGGGALSSNVSKLESKEVSKKLRNFPLAIKKACHCEDERSEDVAIAKSLNINEITTQSSIARNDKYRHAELADCELRAELDGKMAKPLQTSIVDPLNASNQAVSGSQFEIHLTTFHRKGSKVAFTLAEGATHVDTCDGKRKIAFTLAEVLITLGIIGVVAALTLPSVVSNVNNMNYKIAYKKALRDVNEAYKLMEANDSRFSEVVCQNTENCPSCCFSPAFFENFKLLSNQFNATKTCLKGTVADVKRCWECDKGQVGKQSEPPNYYGCNSAPAFIDNSGRAWTMYFANEDAMFVDTNGFKGPNHIGKDRWCFRLPTPKYEGSENYIKPCYSKDLKIKNSNCPSGDCRYKSWLE